MPAKPSRRVPVGQHLLDEDPEEYAHGVVKYRTKWAEKYPEYYRFDLATEEEQEMMFRNELARRQPELLRKCLASTQRAQ